MLVLRDGDVLLEVDVDSENEMEVEFDGEAVRDEELERDRVSDGVIGSVTVDVGLRLTETDCELV